jgi:PPM family protein phosphatase
MITSDKIEIVNVSDIGKRRPHNEDSTLCDAGEGLVILADGMGGYKAGELASAIAVTSIHKNIVDGLQKLKRDKTTTKSGYSKQSGVIKNAITVVNSEIYSAAQQDAQCHGMGTTIVVVLFHNNLFSVGHVGDSRLYRKRADSFTQITKDHSLIQELIDRGLYSPEEAVKHAPKNLVTRAMGIDLDVQVDIGEEPVQAGDIYMLCSDGLNDMVGDEEIHLTLSKYSGNLVQGANELVRLANSKGGKDNISVILVKILEEFSNSGNNRVKKLKSRLFT